MPLTDAQCNQVEATIKTTLRQKFKNYKPETKSMPFHYRLLGRDRMALYSFIQSLNTTFGKSVFEPIAEILANLHYQLAEKQFKVGNQISESAQNEIQHILNELSTGKNPDKEEEINRIRNVCSLKPMNSLKTVKSRLIFTRFRWENPPF